jgi:hypothetical protein
MDDKEDMSACHSLFKLNLPEKFLQKKINEGFTEDEIHRRFGFTCIDTYHKTSTEMHDLIQKEMQEMIRRDEIEASKPYGK